MFCICLREPPRRRNPHTSLSRWPLFPLLPLFVLSILHVSVRQISRLKCLRLAGRHQNVCVEERRALRSGEVSLSASHPSAPGGTSCLGRPSQAVGQKRTRENGKGILRREEDRSNRCGFRAGLANKPLSWSHPPTPPQPLHHSRVFLTS